MLTDIEGVSGDEGGGGMEGVMEGAGDVGGGAVLENDGAEEEEREDEMVSSWLLNGKEDVNVVFEIE